MIEIEKLISCLNKSKKTGENKWLACCPAHDDRNPSLAIKCTDGKILLHDLARVQQAEQRIDYIIREARS